MAPRPTLLSTCALACLGGCGGALEPGETSYVAAASPADAGHYLVLIGSCNDCHTPGWGASGGALPASRWLTGNPVGYRGPWGTSYPSNLRLVVAQESEDAWLSQFRNHDGLPPMPWINYDTMNEADLRAIYGFIQSLGPAGTPAPRNLPPGQEPQTPYILLVPQMPGAAR